MLSLESDIPVNNGRNKHDNAGCGSIVLSPGIEEPLPLQASTALKVTYSFPGSVNGRIIFRQHELSM